MKRWRKLHLKMQILSRNISLNNFLKFEESLSLSHTHTTFTRMFHYISIKFGTWEDSVYDASRPILVNRGAIACVWQWRYYSESQPRLPGLQAFMKACKSVDYPRVTPAAFFPCRGGMEKKCIYFQDRVST